MMRRVGTTPVVVVLASTISQQQSRGFGAIPKEAYDPMRHNPKWYDSYSKKMAQRRIWPTKKYTVGLEPETPADWLQFSKRNLAYQYNGAMRSKNSFPELVPLYQEMKERGVLMDIDTMFIMLSRASRYEKMHVEDIFSLFQEMVDLGARPDMAIAELMQTVLQHHAHEGSPAWREVRRQELIALYVSLASEEVAKYGDKQLEALMKQQFLRYRHNVLTLGGRIPETLWMAVLSRLTHFDDVMEFTASYLWDFVPESMHKKLAVPISNGYPLEVPQVYVALRRPARDILAGGNSKGGAGSSKDDILGNSIGSGKTSTSASSNNAADIDSDFPEDHLINKVFLAGLQRILTYPLKYKGRHARKVPHALMLRVYFALAQRAGFFLTPDVVAQLMDCAKYLVNDVATHGSFDSDHEGVNQSALYSLGCQPQDARPEAGVYGASLAALDGTLRRGQQLKIQEDQDKMAARFLAMGVKGSDYFDDPWRAEWSSFNKEQGTEVFRDGRVLGRYIAARDPWSSKKFSIKLPNGKIDDFAVKGGAAAAAAASGESKDGSIGGESDDAPTGETPSVAEGGNEAAVPKSTEDAGPGASHGMSRSNLVVRSAEDVEVRWADLKELIASSRVLDLKPNHSQASLRKNWNAEEGAWAPMEIFTGQAVFLGKMVAGLPGASRGMVGAGASAEVVLAIQDKLVELHREITEYLIQAHEVFKLSEADSPANRVGLKVEPEVQCWESLVTTATTLMDSLARLNTKTASGVEAKEAAFSDVSALRAKLLSEAKNNWGGKFAMLWLEQS